MIEKIEGLPGNTVGFEAIGTINDNDYKNVIIPAVDHAVKTYGKVRFLYVIGDKYEGLSPVAMFDDAKVGLKHLGDWEKIAVVTNTDWISNAVKVFGEMFKAEVKTFSIAEKETAIKWIME